MKWWLISDEAAKKIRQILIKCGGFADTPEALHTLDSGLHETLAVPTDFLDNLPEDGKGGPDPAPDEADLEDE